MKLLLAEDEKDLSRAIAVILKNNNYTIEQVYNGQDALDYALNSEYDGIIMDIMMPKMDGISVLKKLRENKVMTPVILLTAKAEIDDRVEGLDAGADDYLTKPFAMKELLARIRAMTRRKDKEIELCYEYENISLNPTTFELSTANKSIVLANKEYQMMQMMMANPNRYISTEHFMEKIWGYDSEAEINVVWVYVSYLRKKLKDIDARVTIKAKRGVGYSLEVCDD
ncbi:MAG: response regulator transcription factor [Lachnospiraceae bacterium]|nr:response regulator transcription factor [Lachnospira sp.]MBQ8729689.1 response regulator transcription factor [Lachnospiraceae bacterium]MBR6697609.1 response regulator transcription factor [Lachnospiraceae bacterium]